MTILTSICCSYGFAVYAWSPCFAVNYPQVHVLEMTEDIFDVCCDPCVNSFGEIGIDFDLLYWVATMNGSLINFGLKDLD